MANNRANAFGPNNLGSGSGGGGFGGGLAELISGLFGDSGSPYEEGANTYKPYLDKAIAGQQPYAQAGQNALGPYQDMLKNMSDPSGFINHLMEQYQESPWAKFSQKQGMRAAQNMGSAGGMGGIGSTPLTQFAQQQAQGISSQDMSKWLENVLGTNTQALSGYGNLAGMGQNAANKISDLNNQGGENMAGFSYGKRAGDMQDRNNIFGGIGNIIDGGGGGNNAAMMSIIKMLMAGG